MNMNTTAFPPKTVSNPKRPTLLSRLLSAIAAGFGNWG